MAVAQEEILQKAVEVLRADATLIALLGEIAPGEARVFNHVPQDDGQPYLAIHWEASLPWDTKDSQGYDGIIAHEAVTIHHGDKDALAIQTAVRAAYNAAPIVLASGRVVCFDYLRGSVQTQVLETHRATSIYSVMCDDEGVGGVPITGGSCAEPIGTVPNAGATKGHADFSDCVGIWRLTMTEDTQLLPQNIPNIAETMVYLDLLLRQDGVGNRNFTPPPNTIWEGGAMPAYTTTPNAKSRWMFTTEDGGATWEGFLCADAQA